MDMWIANDVRAELTRRFSARWKLEAGRRLIRAENLKLVAGHCVAFALILTLVGLGGSTAFADGTITVTWAGKSAGVPLRVGETAVLDFDGTIEPLIWESSDGTIDPPGATARRVNFTPTPSTESTRQVRVWASVHWHEVSINVSGPAPRFVNVTLAPLGPKPWGPGCDQYKITGEIENLPGGDYKVALYMHNWSFFRPDQKYEDEVDPVTKAFEFDTIIIDGVEAPCFTADKDRIVLTLIPREMTDAGVVQDIVPSWIGQGFFDPITGSLVPYRWTEPSIEATIDGVAWTASMDPPHPPFTAALGHAYSTHYFSSNDTHPNPAIQNLLRRFSPCQVDDVANYATCDLVPASMEELPRYLIRSHRDFDQFFLYDQAIAAIALIHADERSAAEKILNALDLLQVTTGPKAGSWPISWNYAGENPDGEPETFSGAVAWAVMAANTYRLKYNDERYHVADGMARLALKYLDGLRVVPVVDWSVTPDPDAWENTRPVPMCLAPCDLSGFDQSKVASFEHNIDAYSAFRGFLFFRSLDPDLADFVTAKNDILDFIKSMWNPSLTQSRFYQGLRDIENGVPDDSFALDAQSWAVLALGYEYGALGDEYIKEALDTSCRMVFDPAGYINYGAKGIRGFHDNPDQPGFVWFEGTLGQALSANLFYDVPITPEREVWACHGRDGNEFIDELELSGILVGDGGYIYATYNDVDGGPSSSSSIAGTAWMYFAKENYNPFRPWDYLPDLVPYSECEIVGGEVTVTVTNWGRAEAPASKLRISYSASPSFEVDVPRLAYGAQSVVVIVPPCTSFDPSCYMRLDADADGAIFELGAGAEVNNTRICGIGSPAL